MAFFFEGEFALFVIIFVLSSTPIFTTLRIVSAIPVPGMPVLDAVEIEVGSEVVQADGLQDAAYFSLILRHVGF